MYDSLHVNCHPRASHTVENGINNLMEQQPDHGTHVLPLIHIDRQLAQLTGTSNWYNYVILSYNCLPQVYCGLDVGSAKLPVDQRQGIPHHLIDIIEPGEEFSAGDFYAVARAATEDIFSR